MLAAGMACHSSSSSPSAPGPFGSDVAVTSKLHLDNLSGPVDMVRDKNGMVHLYATSTTDLVRVQGYQMAKDRTAQLELVRRVAEGKLAELLGDTQPSLIDDDIAMRTIGLGRVAKVMYDALPVDNEVRAWLDAFADGVSQFNARVRAGDEDIPHTMVGISKSAFEPWTGVDALAIGRLQSQRLAYTADTEIAESDFVGKARDLFTSTAADPLVAKRAGFLVDVVRFAPIDPTLALDGLPNDTTHTQSAHADPRGQAAMPHVARVEQALFDGAKAWREAQRHALSMFGKVGSIGSNNWVVGPSRTATGHAMLASDPHLSLSAPSVFWMVHLSAETPDKAKRVAAAGLAFPGIPGIILGFNENVAWGATTAYYDVTDVYRETFTADGSAVVFNGQSVPLQKLHETIKIAGRDPLEYDVLFVPHHGPIVPTIVNHAVVAPKPSDGALSIKWTGLKPTHELEAVAGFLRAKDVEDMRVAYRSFEVGAQNWVMADTSGNIFYTSQAQVPLRDKRAFTWDPKKFAGQLPCYVLPGDGSAEWTGVLDEANVPHVKNPPKAYVGTANGDQVGTTLDNDPSNDTLPNGQPIYLACWYDAGFRVGRIHQRIENLGHPMTLDDMANIQADARSSIGARLAPKLLLALAHADEERAAAGTHADLTSVVTSARYQAAPVAELRDALARWGTDSDYDTPAGVSLDDGSLSSDAKEALASKATLVFNAWLPRMIGAVLDDELDAVGWHQPPIDLTRVLVYLMEADPKTMATFDAAMRDSALFDDMRTKGVVESRDERAITSLLDALDLLQAKAGSDRSAWRWGKLHTLRFEALVPLWGALSIPPVGDSVFPNGFPRHGDGFGIDVAEYNHRPAKYDDLTFTYGEGSTQRFVIDMDPAKLAPRNVLPGGEVWDTQSPHFRDQAEEWRRNQNHPIPFTHADVVTAAEERIVYTP